MKQWLRLAAIGLICGATGAGAAVRNWISGDGTWDNGNTASWSGGAVPVNGDTVTITNPSAGTLTVTYNASNLSGNGLASLAVANAGGGLNTLNVGAGVFLPTIGITLGAGGKVVQSDGFMIISTTGDSTLNGGTLQLSGGTNQTQSSINFNAGYIQQVLPGFPWDYSLARIDKGC